MAEPPESPRNAGKSERERRLAAALRENLRKRKSQTRGRRESDMKHGEEAGEGRPDSAPREEER